MKKKTIKRKSILSVLVLLIIFIVILIKAYSSGQESIKSAKVDTAKTETTVDTVKEERTEEITTPEPTIEPTPEPTPVPTPDTESTLPGVEWIKTFDGIIDEPKLVVFNDSTNKKVILEELEEVEFYDDDTLAVYIPQGKGKIVRYFNFEEVEDYDNVVTLKNISTSIRREGYSSATIVDIEFDGEPMTLYCYLKLMG